MLSRARKSNSGLFLFLPSTPLYPKVFKNHKNVVRLGEPEQLTGNKLRYTIKWSSQINIRVKASRCIY